MSEFKVEIVRLGTIEKLPNSDTLMITNVLGGYPCIVKVGSFREGDLAAYCPIDSIVPTTHPAFAFLQDSRGNPTSRLKAKRLRGTFSMGLLVPAPAGAKVGEDVQALFGIEKWEPDESNRKPGRAGGKIAGGDSEKDPGFLPEYTDLEGLRRWGKVFQEGDPVQISEKCHGCSSRYVFSQGRLWCGSRHQIKRAPREPTRAEFRSYQVKKTWWRLSERFWDTLHGAAELIGIPVTPKTVRPPEPPRGVRESVWWQVARLYDLETRLKSTPDIAIYGEIYGPTQDLKYDSPDAPKLAVYDVMDLQTRRWYDTDEAITLVRRLGLEMVPEIYRGPWKEELRDLAEGPTTIGSGAHVREGIVIRSLKEETHPGLSRKILKLVGQGYLLR